MSLEEYRRKRDFTRTREPEGKAPWKKDNRLIYVVHKHQASHLHYDFRLEMDGVLKSWAVPKGPPAVAGVKRLAVQVEDHPLEYSNFEGIIPEGGYGAGKVEIWDRGYYHLKEINRDLMMFELQGEKLKGRYALVRLKSRKSTGKEWLLFKTK
jgi:DNA ligase D-like protein (predicted 3'-phosphoesterase)